MTPARLRAALRRAYGEAIDSVDLEARVRAATPRPPRSARRVVVVAIGKAAPAMARGALAALGERVERALVVAPDGTPVRTRDRRVEVLRAPHPDPDARSVRAAHRTLEVVREADFVVALVSGGASSLVCLPEGVTLARYVRLVGALLRSGAPVRAINVVRRHLCAIKGGGLARAAGGAVVTLVASDVIGGTAIDVGSGLTVRDPTRPSDARRVLRRYVPDEPAPPLRAAFRLGRAAATARIVLRPADLAAALGTALRAFVARVDAARPSDADVEALAREYVRRARVLAPGEALVRVAEPSVHVTARHPGRGGRCTHLAALLAPHLPAGVAFLAAASDGVDGASGTGGALVDASVARRAPLATAVAAFDTGAALAAAGAALPMRPSGLNLTDVHALVRAPSF
jgi:glycerate-2-kinase